MGNVKKMSSVSTTRCLGAAHQSGAHSLTVVAQTPRETGIRLVLVSAWLVGLLALGCSPGFDDITEVKDLRALVVQASPPQHLILLAPDVLFTSITAFKPPVELTQSVDVAVTLLVVDPSKTEGDVKVTLRACVLGGDRRCRDDYPIVPIADKWVPLGESTFVASLPPDLLNGAMEEDSIKGIFGAAVWLDGEVTDGVTVEPFLKTFILMTDYSGGQQAQNVNPTFNVVAGEEEKEKELELNAEGQLEVATGEEVRFLPVIPEEEHQDFVVFTFTQGQDQEQAAPEAGFEEKTEEMTIRYFSTCGSLSTDFKSEQTVIFWEKDDPLEDKDLSVKWTAPDEADECLVWFLLEDGRGGVNWLELPVVVK